MRPGITEVIKHKRGTTLRIPSTFPDSPSGWTFSAAIQLPDGTRLPLLCRVVDPDAYTMGEVPPAGYGLLYLEMTAEQSTNLPLRLLPCDYRATAGAEAAAPKTFYIHVLAEVTQ